MKTAILIVNWNNWEDTIRCIISCCNLDNFNSAFFICDNNSSDNSIKNIENWTHGLNNVNPDTNNSEILLLLKNKATNLVIHIGTLDFLIEHIATNGCTKNSIYLIKSQTNLGFAGGNNLCLKLALSHRSFDLFWLLNSDTVVRPDTLIPIEEKFSNINRPIIAGSILIEYWKPTIIQAAGGKFSHFSLSTSHLLAGEHITALEKLPIVMTVDYPVGASLFLNRAYLIEFGLVSESYFLYFEELDLCSKLGSDSIFVHTKSLVYHKGGSSTAGGSNIFNKSSIANYYFIRARIIFARKLGISYFLRVIPITIFSIFKRIVFLKFRLALGACKAAFDGISYNIKN